MATMVFATAGARGAGRRPAGSTDGAGTGRAHEQGSAGAWT